MGKDRPVIFILDDYLRYKNLTKSLKRYHELDRKRGYWEGIDKDIKLFRQLGLHPGDSRLNSWVTGKLTDNEEGEIYNLETELDEDILGLTLKDLSIEQWSFVKTLYPNLDERGLNEVISGLSKEFMGQLNMRETDLTANMEFRVIKSQYVNHCKTLIAHSNILTK